LAGHYYNERSSARYIQSTEKKNTHIRAGDLIQKIKEVKTGVTGAEDGKVKKEAMIFFLSTKKLFSLSRRKI